MLEAGSITPAIALEDADGNEVTLADFRGDRHVLVYFMRSTTCPVCNLHVKHLAKRVARYGAQDVQILVAVPEGPQEASRWASEQRLPFPVVTGRAGTPHEAVGLVKKVFGGMQQSGSILIDRTGVIRHVHATTLPTGSLDKRGIERALDRL